jgi:hypothetical protein
MQENVLPDSFRGGSILLQRRQLQSRSPSLRSSGRNTRLWDNPFQGGIWLAVEMECVVQSEPGFLASGNGLSQSLAFLPEDRRLGERGCVNNTYFSAFQRGKNSQNQRSSTWVWFLNVLAQLHFLGQTYIDYIRHHTNFLSPTTISHLSVPLI